MTTVQMFLAALFPRLFGLPTEEQAREAEAVLTGANLVRAHILRAGRRVWKDIPLSWRDDREPGTDDRDPGTFHATALDNDLARKRLSVTPELLLAEMVLSLVVFGFEPDEIHGAAADLADVFEMPHVLCNDAPLLRVAVQDARSVVATVGRETDRLFANEHEARVVVHAVLWKARRTTGYTSDDWSASLTSSVHLRDLLETVGLRYRMTGDELHARIRWIVRRRDELRRWRTLVAERAGAGQDDAVYRIVAAFPPLVVPRPPPEDEGRAPSPHGGRPFLLDLD
jgi:hypothetical protein